MKTCTKCGVLKEYSNFHKYSRSKDGYKPWCKGCVKRYDDAEYDGKRVFSKKRQGNLLQCRRCERYLELDKFPKNRKNGKYKQLSYCLECDNQIGHTYNIKRFGITPDQYVDMEKEQDGKCKICGEQDKKRLSVDHDHSCCDGSVSCGNCIRGLLCSRCNKTLGQVKDNVDILHKMIKYLNDSQKPQNRF